MRGVSSSGSTRSSGRSGGQVGISNGNIELGVDLGIAGLGISFGYGGAIVVKFAGQTIVWGREGGEIRLRVGGFDVDVIAKDCIVTETKRIAGQIVSARTYHDPGCKPPDPPAPTPTPILTPTPSAGIEISDTDEIGWAITSYAGWQQDFGSRNIRRSTYEPTIEDISISGKQEPLPFSIYRFTGDVLHRVLRGGMPAYRNTVLWSDEEMQKPSGRAQPYGAVQELLSLQYKLTFNGSDYWIGTSGHGYSITLGFFGKSKDIKKVLGQQAKRDDFLLADALTNYRVSPWGFRHIPIAFIPLNPATNKPQPSGGNKPPMPDRCCEALKADLEDIKEVLATKEMLGRKLTFPWRLRMPGGSGEEVITDYPNLIRALAQQIDHLGLHPPRLYIKDNNNAIDGDQEVDEQFPSATRALEAMLAKTWNTHSDLATVTNFLYRLAFLNVNQSTSIAKLQADTMLLKDMLGGEREDDVASINTPFNIAAGTEKPSTRGKGFGKGAKVDPKIDLNTEKTTEQLIPDVLKMRNNEILIERFAGNKDIFDMLSLIILKLEALQFR
jgi:hypothetical protein